MFASKDEGMDEDIEDGEIVEYGENVEQGLSPVECLYAPSADGGSGVDAEGACTSTFAQQSSADTEQISDARPRGHWADGLSVDPKQDQARLPLDLSNPGGDPSPSSQRKRPREAGDSSDSDGVRKRQRMDSSNNVNNSATKSSVSTSLRKNICGELLMGKDSTGLLTRSDKTTPDCKEEQKRVSFHLNSRGKVKPERLTFDSIMAAAKMRNGTEWDTCMKDTISAIQLHDRIDLLVNVISSTPLWESLGDWVDIHDAGLAALLDVLKEVEVRGKSMRVNFRHALRILCQSRLLQQNGRFSKFVIDMVQSDDKETLLKIENFLVVLMKQIPDQSKFVVGLVQPIIESSSSPTFLYKLLKVAVEGSQGKVDMNWDELPFLPTVAELVGDSSKSSPKLMPVKIDKPYSNCVEYLETYFRLLRSDCFNGLTAGVKNLLRGRLDPADMNVYRDIQLAGIHLRHRSECLSLVIRLAPDTRKNAKWSNKLVVGKLVCITASASFRDPVWATVSNRELLGDKLVIIDLCSGCNTWTDAEVIAELQSADSGVIMVECPTFYQAYQPVLRELQNLEPNKLALCEEIVHSQAPTVPSYIRQDTTIDASILYDGAPDRTSVLQYCEGGLNLGSTTLDTSQEASVRSALKNRVALIQGPPGTGKTYIGVRLVKLLLSLSTLPKKPILVLTYKNHALDEFLKDVLLQVTKSVVRVGGRSKDPTVAQCSLQKVQKNLGYNLRQRLYDNIKTHGTKVEEAFDLLQQSRVLDVAGFSRYLTRAQAKLFIQRYHWSDTTRNAYVKKAFDILKDCKLSQNNRLSLADNHTGRDQLHHCLEAAFNGWLPNMGVFNEMEARVASVLHTKPRVSSSHKASVARQWDEGHLDEEPKERQAEHVTRGNKTKEDMLREIRFLQDATMERNAGPHLFPGAKALVTSTQCGDVLLGVDNLWTLDTDEKIRLVQYMIYTNYKEASETFEQALVLYQQTRRIQNETKERIGVDILNQHQVIGMTMTGASIYNHYLKAVRPSVVIVEEAAEVLEPQLLAALGDWTKHLILIGDHKQLRPSVESYVLARDYHLDVSMMERLIKNNQPYTSLEVQNRMKPEFAELLLDIYPHLRSNLALVGNNSKADCIGNSMFFWETNDPETKERSCTNEGEAERAVRLALFLVQQDYQPKSITILAPYQGQVSLIRRKLSEAKQTYKQMFEPFEPEMEHSKENRDQHTDENIVRVYTIDMYQGDENDFVIISLVRSNPKGELGFLKVLNRRCVAQSRARRGMYFIGNRNLLESNRHWLKMITTMQEKGCTGTAISLHCPSHPTTSTITAVNAKDITLGAFCEKRCEVHMPCLEHICRKSCQPRHVHRPCVESVDFVFERCHHLGTKPCYKGESEMYCRQEVSMTFPKCGHSGHRLCYEEEESQLCPEACPLNFPCGHPCREQCGNACNPDDCPPCMEIKRIEAEKRREDEGKIRRRLEREITLQLEAMRRVRPGYFKHDLYPIGDTASEYLDAEDRVKKYIQPGHNWFPMITKIEKITNSRLEEKWLQEKLRLLDPRKRSELKFHGTTKEAIEAIISKGFKLPVRKKQMYGVGLYFASDSSKSAQEIYTKGSNMLLMSEVLLGKSLTVDSARTSMTHKELHELGYDSLFAKRGTQKSGGVLNDEFVVYHRDQAIPRYIIHYDATGINSDCGCFSDLEQQALLAGKLTKYSMHPKRTVNYTSDPLDIHFRMAESQFLRLMQRTGGNHTVTSVDYYINPLLLTKFQDKSHEFQTKYRAQDDAECILAFHGTNDDNIDSILNGNFRLDKCARGAFGAGIYFSEFPDISMGYGGKLLLCKVLPGRSYDCPGGMPNSALQPGYDSHRVQKDTQGRGRELVIYNPDQILPCYVINF